MKKRYDSMITYGYGIYDTVCTGTPSVEESNLPSRIKHSYAETHAYVT